MKSENVIKLDFLYDRDLTLHQADKREQHNFEPHFQFASQHPHI